MDTLLAQGKPVPSAERFELDKQQAMVPMEARLVFGNAPYATGEDLAGIYYGPGGGGGGAGSAELVQLVRQQGDLLKGVSGSLQLLSTQISDEAASAAAARPYRFLYINVKRITRVSLRADFKSAYGVLTCGCSLLSKARPADCLPPCLPPCW
jgi:hypothetical protein